MRMTALTPEVLTTFDTLFAEGEIDLVDARNLPCHTGVRLLGGSSHALGRVNADKKVQLVRGDREVFGLRGRSAEQRVALDLLLDESVRIDDRKRAVALLEPLNDLACVEPLRSHTFRDPHLEQEVNLAIGKLLANHFLKECPYCAELIKSRATVCKHCQRELSA